LSAVAGKKIKGVLRSDHEPIYIRAQCICHCSATHVGDSVQSQAVIQLIVVS